MDLKKHISNMPKYPKNGEHQVCDIYLDGIRLPFDIGKGRDEYWWVDDKGKEHQYNGGPRVTKKWICHVYEDGNKSLLKIFRVKQSTDLDKICQHCVKLYWRSLKMEMKYMNKQIKELDKRLNDVLFLEGDKYEA